MNIVKALELKPGDKVEFPPDRGSRGGQGIVQHVGSNIYRNIYGVNYVWVTLADTEGKSKGVWPSNRIN